MQKDSHKRQVHTIFLTVPTCLNEPGLYGLSSAYYAQEDTLVAKRRTYSPIAPLSPSWTVPAEKGV